MVKRRVNIVIIVCIILIALTSSIGTYFALLGLGAIEPELIELTYEMRNVEHEYDGTTVTATQDDFILKSGELQEGHYATFYVEGELTDEERIRAFDLVNETIKILKASNVCDRFNVIFEEKQGSHFHIWIMPRHKWMEDVAGKITKNIGMIFNYAKQNLRTEENLKEISKISQVVKEDLKNFKR